jgi:hypothetical protein
VPAKPRRAQYEQVVAGLVHLGAEPDCSERTFLTDQAGQGLQVCCRLEAESGLVGAHAKLARFKRRNGWACFLVPFGHEVSSLDWL